nr:MAG TPA: hypothetical protein [Caudoviricetes sp.]
MTILSPNRVYGHADLHPLLPFPALYLYGAPAVLVRPLWRNAPRKPPPALPAPLLIKKTEQKLLSASAAFILQRVLPEPPPRGAEPVAREAGDFSG